MLRLLLVDDEPAVLYALSQVLSGYERVTAPDAEAALAELEGVDLVLSDLSMPGRDGLALLAEVRARRPEVPFVLLTARGSERLAVQALRAGAFDYLTKPFDIDELAATVARAAELVEARRAARTARAELGAGHALIGASPALRRVVEAAIRLAPRDVHVLVTGETGTGKELIANLLHQHGRRAARPLVRFSAAALPETLAEAELFGHERGAFTGATAARRGYFAQADGGTLVIDEVGELPAGVQAKLLRAVQQGELQRLGARAVERVDVRVVSCTHRRLPEEVAAGRFRDDLYHRLAVVELTVPPLRERPEDVAPLAQHFAARAAARFGVEDVTLTPALLDALRARSWPGNVRELENTVTRLVALSEEGGPLGVEALGPPGAPAPATASTGGTFRERMAAHERALLTDALTAAGGNQSEAARRLGLSRVTFLDRWKRVGGP